MSLLCLITTPGVVAALEGSSLAHAPVLEGLEQAHRPEQQGICEIHGLIFNLKYLCSDNANTPYFSNAKKHHFWAKNQTKE